MREEVGFMYVSIESVMSRPTSISGRTMVAMPGLDVSCKSSFQLIYREISMFFFLNEI